MISSYLRFLMSTKPRKVSISARELLHKDRRKEWRQRSHQFNYQPPLLNKNWANQRKIPWRSPALYKKITDKFTQSLLTFQKTRNWPELTKHNRKQFYRHHSRNKENKSYEISRSLRILTMTFRSIYKTGPSNSWHQSTNKSAKNSNKWKKNFIRLALKNPNTNWP